MPRLRTIDRKLSRGKDHRRILIRTLATQLIMHKTIKTNYTRAKVLVPYVERLISKAKRGDLASRRYARARLDTVEATHILLDEIAPQIKRDSGFVRVKPSPPKSGDNTKMSIISFVDEFSSGSTSVSPPITNSKTTKTKVKS